MPDTPPFSFRCPFCQTVLTVAAELMGTTGPCPKCEKPIRCPQVPYPGFVPPPVSASSPDSWKSTTESKSSPSSTPHDKDEKKDVPKIQPREVRKATFSEVKQPTPTFKPERTGKQVLQEKQQRERRIPLKFVVRALLPIVFTGAVLVLIVGIRKVLMTQGKEAAPKEEVVADDTEATTKSKNPNEHLLKNGDLSARPESRAASSAEAMLILEKFLKAKTLEDRLPLIETTVSEEELSESILAKQLPEFRNISVDSQKSFPLESVVDYFFGMEFVNEDGSANRQLMAVRVRGDMKPKVLADPILDLFGGRLEAFAAEPQKIGKTFYAVIKAVPSCTDTRIPNRGKKLTLKLLSHENSGDPVIAYASKVSDIGEMLSLGNYDLTYINSKPCVILLGWNTEEQPDAPYLEALDIQSTNWNP